MPNCDQSDGVVLSRIERESLNAAIGPRPWSSQVSHGWQGCDGQEQIFNFLECGRELGPWCPGVSYEVLIRGFPAPKFEGRLSHSEIGPTAMGRSRCARGSRRDSHACRMAIRNPPLGGKRPDIGGLLGL